MPSSQENNINTETDERLSALITNASAVRAIAGAVENTLGPKGMDTMLVDSAGNIVVTNAGVTILDSMEVTHPAARMLISIARNQHNQAGDGTTTATIMAGTLVSEGLNHIMRGVPAGRIIDGITNAIDKCLCILKEKTIKINGFHDPLLKRAVMIAGRGDINITDSVIELAKKVGEEKIKDKAFKLSDRLISISGAESNLFNGLVIKKRRQNDLMPVSREKVKTIIFNDAIMPEELSENAMRTEAGFSAYKLYQEEFRRNLTKFKDLGIKLVISSKGIDPFAEEFFTTNEIMAVTRVFGKQLTDISEFTGGKPLRRNALEKNSEEIEKSLGYLEFIEEDVRYGLLKMSGGKGASISTFIQGASTEEITYEKERIAQDACASLKSAFNEGVIAGGGAFELSLIPILKSQRDGIKDLSAYGIDCVIEALKRPMSQITSNAGFNPLEKLELALGTHKEKQGYWGIDCDTGELTDMFEKGVLDSSAVKRHALISAKEIAQAILRINTIIRMKNQPQ